MLTLEEVSRIAENLVQGQKLVSYDFSDKSRETLGYLGKHLTLTLNFEFEKRKLFVKTYNVTADKEDYLGDTGIFKREQNFYGMILRDIKELDGEHNWSPECYFTKDRVIVLEDLSEEGYKISEDGLGVWALERQHLDLAVKTLASMHATSMLLEFKKNKTLPPMYPTILLKGLLYTENEPESATRKWISWQVQDLIMGINFLDKYSPDEKKFIQESFEEQIMRIYPLSQVSKKYRNTLIHGDLWKNNLMFKYSPEGTPIDCKFVDFQFIRYAPPAHDITHLLNYALKKSERDRYFSHYLKLYYQNLKAKLEEIGLEEEITEDELFESCKEYNEVALIQCILSLHYILGPVTLNIETESYDKYEEYLNTHRDEYMKKFFEKDSYAEKIKDMFYELIDEYILIK